MPDRRDDVDGLKQFEMGMQMHRDTHELIKSLKQDITTINSKLDAHEKDDKTIHDMVYRHTTYWKIVTGGCGSLLAYLGVTK